MPIITLQRQLREVGRIRIGQQVPTTGGKLRPSKLEHFRFSSPDQQAIKRAAILWGGEVAPMDNPASHDRWQVVSTSAEIPVLVPPRNAFSQWFESWSGGGCQRRCDGERMIILDGRRVDTECVCDPDDRMCKATTRLNLILPDLEALGVWRLESHGYYAAVELAMAAELCERATASGLALPARLLLEQRQRKTPEGVRRFAVPVLAVDVNVHQAALAVGAAPLVDRATGEIASVPVAEPAALTAPEPVPPADDEVVAAVLDALQQIPAVARADAKRAFIARFGAPPSALTADQQDDAMVWALQRLSDELAPELELEPEPEPEPELELGPEPEPEPVVEAVPVELDAPPVIVWPTAKARGRIFGMLKEHGLTEEDRRGATLQATRGRADSLKGLTAEELSRIGDILEHKATAER